MGWHGIHAFMLVHRLRNTGMRPARRGNPSAMNDELRTLIEIQSGVVSRRQALAAGLHPHDIRRLLRRREWASVHDGVYVDHTGALTWLQRAWGGVLFAEPAALGHQSALRAADGPGRRDRDDQPIHIAVDRHRSIVAPPGVVPHRLTDLDEKVQWNLSPPRVRIEHAVLDLAAEAADEFTAISLIADAVQARRTTANRILEALGTRGRIARRAFLSGVLLDVAGGTCSVLEHGYLTRVERAHGLPTPGRQVRASTRGPIYRDVDYQRFGLIVELDGRQFHDNAAARDDDLERDLDSAIERGMTVRLGWGQVFARACLTAPKIGMLLQRRGWDGAPHRCPSCPDG